MWLNAERKCALGVSIKNRYLNRVILTLLVTFTKHEDLIMTPQQKIKWAILSAAAFNKTDAPAYPCENVDELYDALVENDEHWDAQNEVRCSGVETKLPCQGSRHYESDAVAMKMPDDSWVGWTYWYGGGKHAEPEEIDWIEDAYNVDCHEEEKVVVVQTFSAQAA